MQADSAAAPTVSSVAISGATNAQNSLLNTGDVVSITVTFSSAVTVNTSGGTPSIAIDIGGVSRSAAYSSGSGTTSIVFAYTIASSETTDTDGISIGANAISLNSGTMKDSSNQNATLTHSAVSANSSFKVDTTAPTISSVSLASDNSTATVTFSEDVYTNSNGSGDLTAADFTLSLSGGNASSISLNATASSISKTSQSVWVLTLNGTDLDSNASGEETLVVDSASDTAIYDYAGTAHTAAHGGQSLNSTVTSTSKSITSSGGTVSTSGGSVTIPSDALSSSATIGMNVADTSTLADGTATTVVKESYSPIISLTPHGQEFDEAVTVSFDITGSSAGSCPSDLKLFKRNDASSIWYEVPSSLWSCSSGTISLSTTKFSQYQAIGGEDMAITRARDHQLRKINTVDKINPRALNLVGSGSGTSDINYVESLTAVEQDDVLLIGDASEHALGNKQGKKITFSDFEDEIFSNISGEATIAAGGAITLAATNTTLTTLANVTTVGALDAGSITSGFGAIDNGTSNITTGGLLKIDVDGTGINAAGALTMGAGNDAAMYWDGGSLVIDTASGADIAFEVAGTEVASLDADGLSLASGDAYQIAGTSVLSASTLGSGVTASSLTSVGTIATGVWNGSVIESAYLDADTAHLSTDQTFTGAKTFSADATFTGDTNTFSSSNSADPLIEIKNTTNDENGARLRFVKDKGAAGAANDVAGIIEFYADDAAQDQVLFAQIKAIVADATNGAEGGKLELGVASHDGEMNAAITITDGSKEDEVDVTIGSGSDSLTLIRGDLQVDGTTTTVNSTTVQIDDLNLQLADGAAAASAVDGGGITLAHSGDDFTWQYNHATTAWKSSIDVDMASGKALKINGNSVLNASTLGSGVTASSLTSVGTITNGVWNGTAIAHDYIGLDAIDGTNIQDDAIDSEHYVDGSIDTAHLAADAVTGAKIADDSIDSEHYVDGSIDTAHLAADAVTGAKIADDSIDSEHYVDGSIDTAHLAADAVTAAKLADDAVVTANIVDSNVTTAKIADLNVTTGKLAADAVTAAKLADDAVVTANIVDANVTTAKIAADAVTAAKLADDAVVTANIVDSNVTTAKIADSNVTTAKLAADAVTAAKLADDAVVTANIVDENVTTAKLAADAVTAAKLADDAVVTANIVDSNVTTAKIADDAVTKAKVASDVAGDGVIQHTDGSLKLVPVKKVVFGTNDTKTGSDTWGLQGAGTSSNKYYVEFGSASEMPFEETIQVFVNGVLMTADSTFDGTRDDSTDPKDYTYTEPSGGDAGKITFEVDVIQFDDDVITVSYLRKS